MSGSVSSPLGQINLRSSLCGAAHMELNATCCEGANRTNTVLWLLLYRHYCCQLHKGNQNQHRWQDRSLISRFKINSFDSKPTQRTWSCAVKSSVLPYIFVCVQADRRRLDINIRARAPREYPKMRFQSFFSTCPLSRFAYEHSPKYPHKRLMSFCSCILPFIGRKTMHQSVCASILDSYFARKRCYATGKCILIVQSLGAACK